MRLGVVLAAALAAGLPARDARASLAGPSIHGLAVSATDVAVQVGSRVLIFDHDGAFQREVESALADRRARLLALGDGGRLWFVVADEDGGAPGTLAATDESGAVVVREALPPGWTARLAPDGRAFVGRLETGRLRVERLEQGARAPHAVIPLEGAPGKEERTIPWAVHDGGDVSVLLSEGADARVTRFRPDGTAVRTWRVAPDPVTSVAYMKDVLVGGDGALYATHSSWEVSSSTANSGSVLRLDPSGGPPLRIKDGIGYLQQVAVSPSGDAFVSDLSETVSRFSGRGERVATWTAVPPRHGESWEERSRRIAAAARIGPEATTGELVVALVYGNYEALRKARALLVARGAAALAEATAAALRFPGEYFLGEAVEGLWTAHLDETVRLFETSKDERLRRRLAPFLAYQRPSVAGLRELLGRMALEGDERAGYALDQVGPTPEVVQARIAAFRRSLRSGTSTFDVAYRLRATYASSIGPLEAILLDAADPDRSAVRDLMLEASLDLATPEGSKGAARPGAADVVARTRAWSRHADPFVRDTAAVALTGLGVTGQEAAAIEAARRSPSLFRPALRAFALLAPRHAAAVAPHVEALAGLARASTPSDTTGDALTDLAKIPHPAVVARCLRDLTDASLTAERRAAILLGLDVKTIPRPALLALLRDQVWQRALAGEYYYHAFLENVVEAHPDDDTRAEVKAALFAIALDPLLAQAPAGEGDRKGPRAHALAGLEGLVDGADLPRLAPLLDDPGLDGDLRATLLGVLSRLAPDAATAERLRPLLKDPALALSVAQSLGRAGDPGALEVLVEQGLKRMGYYSRVALDVGSFRPLGADAEQALLALLDYPNGSTRAAVRQLLVEWPSAEGRRRIRAELDASVSAGRAPATETLAALALAEEDVVAPLLRLATEHPDALESLRSDHPSEPLTRQLRSALARETDAGRRRALESLVARLCGCEGE